MKEKPKKKIKVNLFIPCFIDQIFPQTGMNMVKVLEKAGCEVHYNPNQTCCGQPGFNAGFWNEARFTATGFPRVFYLRYHGYPKFFPLWALARYRNLIAGNAKSASVGM